MEEDRKVAGFIMNKLWSYRYVGGQHTSVDNLPKGYPLSGRGLFPSVVKRLKKEGYLVIHPTSYGPQVSASIAMRAKALDLANEYRTSVGMLSLGLDLKEQQAPRVSETNKR